MPPTDVQRYYNDNIQQYQTPEQIRASHILLKTAGKDEATVRKQAEDILQAGQGRRRLRRAGQASTRKTRARRSTAATSITSAAAAWCRSSRTAAFAHAARTDQRPGEDAVRLPHHQGGGQAGRARRGRSTRCGRRSRSSWRGRRPTSRSPTARAELGAAHRRSPSTSTRWPTRARPDGAGVRVLPARRPVPGLGVAPQVAQAAFRWRTTRSATPIASPRGPVFITVTGKKDPYVPTLDEVKERVREDADPRKARELSRQRAPARSPRR